FPEVIGGRDVEFTLDRDDHAAVLHPRAQSKPVHVHSSRPHMVMVRGPFVSPYADRRTPPTCSDTTPTEPDRGKMQMMRPRGLVDRWTLTVSADCSFGNGVGQNFSPGGHEPARKCPISTAYSLLSYDIEPGLTYYTSSLRALVSLLLRSEEHTSELQSRFDLVCRLLLEKNNKK